MKKFLFITGIVVLGAGIFVVGLVVGTHLDFMNAFVSSSHLHDNIIQASTTLVWSLANILP